jgi:hypothetical protein
MSIENSSWPYTVASPTPFSFLSSSSTLILRKFERYSAS